MAASVVTSGRNSTLLVLPPVCNRRRGSRSNAMAPPAFDEFQASVGGVTSLSTVVTVQVILKSDPATGSG